MRSIREGNFKLYIEIMRKLLKWYFIFDHYNYARWLTIHWFDLSNLHIQFPDVFEYFSKGYFSFQKSNREFSRMGLDQLHEQNNSIIKGCGGATDLVNKIDDSALVRWETCGPDIARLLLEFENTIERDVLSGVRVENTMKIMMPSKRDLNLMLRRYVKEWLSICFNRIN